jgi:hypothetical protein
MALSAPGRARIAPGASCRAQSIGGWSGKRLRMSEQARMFAPTLMIVPISLISSHQVGKPLSSSSKYDARAYLTVRNSWSDNVIVCMFKVLSIVALSAPERTPRGRPSCRASTCPVGHAKDLDRRIVDADIARRALPIDCDVVRNVVWYVAAIFQQLASVIGEI